MRVVQWVPFHTSRESPLPCCRVSHTSGLAALLDIALDQLHQCRTMSSNMDVAAFEAGSEDGKPRRRGHCGPVDPQDAGGPHAGGHAARFGAIG